MNSAVHLTDQRARLLLGGTHLTESLLEIDALLLDPRQILLERAGDLGQLAARVPERVAQRRYLGAKLAEARPAALEVLRQRLALPFQPEREFRSLRLDRRDLGLDTLEPRRGRLEAFRQSVRAAIQLRQPLREHAQAAVDLIELAFERGGALTQAVRSCTGLAVGLEHLTPKISDRAVANACSASAAKRS